MSSRKLKYAITRTLGRRSELYRRVLNAPTEAVHVVEVSDSSRSLCHSWRPSADCSEAIELKLSLSTVSDVEVFGHTGAMVEVAGWQVIAGTHAERNFTPNDVRAKWLRPCRLRTDEIAINILGRHKGHTHLYHFVVGQLFLLWVALRYGVDADAKYVVLCREDMPSWQRGLVDALITKHPNVRVRSIESSERCEVTRALLADTEEPDEDGCFMPPGDYMREVSRMMCRGESAGHARRLYVDRSNAKKRRIRNGQELSSALFDLEFEAVRPEELSMHQQASLFAGAKMIVAPHGNALTHLMHVAERGCVYEIFARDFVHSHYQKISRSLGLHHTGFVGSPMNRNQDFDAPVERVVEAVRAELGV